MNDKSEGFYLDKCLKGDSIYLYRKPQSFIDKYNNIFILSLCDANKKDDLTMWRLYGNDCKGVCLVYEVDLNVVLDSEEFFLMPVSYGENNKVIILFRILGNLPYIDGLKLGLADKHIWQYFVKPDSFEMEEEYRLLYLPQGWLGIQRGYRVSRGK